MYRYSIFSVLTKYLLPILFIFNRIHSTTWLGSQSEVKLGIFTETTGITQERVFLIIVNSSAKCPQKSHINTIKDTDGTTVLFSEYNN